MGESIKARDFRKLFALDEQAGIGCIHADKVSVGISGVAETVIDFSGDVIVLITDDLGFVRESACDAGDDSSISVAHIGLGE